MGKPLERFYVQKYSNFGSWVVNDREKKFEPQTYATRKAARFARDAMNKGGSTPVIPRQSQMSTKPPSDAVIPDDDIQIMMFKKDDTHWHVILRHPDGREEISHNSFPNRQACEEGIRAYAAERRMNLQRAQ